MADRIGKLPSLNGVRVFEVVTRHLNFRLAAEELGVTQGAVAQQIRGLEAELGLKLFERHPRTLAMTEAGRSYVGSIRRAFELISEATETLRPEPQHLTISVTPTFASKWLIPRLPEFTAAHPEIDLRILATDRIANFQTDAVDLAVRYGRPPFGPGLQADLLFEHVVIALGSPLLIDKFGAPELPGNLARYALLHDAHNFWPQFLELAMGQAAPVTAAKNIRFKPDLARAGSGDRRTGAGARQQLLHRGGYRGRSPCAVVWHALAGRGGFLRRRAAKIPARRLGSCRAYLASAGECGVQGRLIR